LITIFNLPQRFQIVNGLSPVEAGIHMLPLLLLTAVASGVTGAICSKRNYAFELLILSNILQIISTGLLSTLPNDGSIPPYQYGLQIVLGFGFGMGLVSLMVITRIEVSADDNAVAMGAITQVRVLGGIIGLVIVQAILLATLRSSLSSVLTPSQLSSILSSTASIASLSPAAQQLTRAAYGDASNVQMRIVAGFGGASLLVSLFTYRKQRVGFADLARGRGPADLRKMAAFEAEVEAEVGREEGEVEGVRMRALDTRTQRSEVVSAEMGALRADDVDREIPI
jgi:hypothetical protein